MLGLKSLHYGYFKPGQELNLDNFLIAQETYIDEMLHLIPDEVKTVLDVGSGTGVVAQRLLELGKSVHCVDPNPYLTLEALKNTNSKVFGSNLKYEDFQLPENQKNGFDLVLMSESCQYIDIENGWKKTREITKPNSYLLVADFFKIKELDKAHLSKSGHRLSIFLETAEKHGFQLVKKVDITSSTAPTMDLYQKIIVEKIFPIAEALLEFLYRRFPRFYRLGRYFWGKKILFLREKYLSQYSQTFSHYKGYFFLLFQKKIFTGPCFGFIYYCGLDFF